MIATKTNFKLLWLKAVILCRNLLIKLKVCKLPVVTCCQLLYPWPAHARLPVSKSSPAWTFDFEAPKLTLTKCSDCTCNNTISETVTTFRPTVFLLGQYVGNTEDDGVSQVWDEQIPFFLAIAIAIASRTDGWPNSHAECFTTWITDNTIPFPG